MSRKKAQQEAEAALTRTVDETKVLVGNLIGEGHVNYVMMYNMLTGIRIGVSHFVLYFDNHAKAFIGFTLSSENQTTVDG